MTTPPAPNPTAEAFGFPATAIRDYRHWLVLVRPHQCTLGALVTVCKDPATAFSAVTPDAFAELAAVTADVEAGLTSFCPYQKINYLMLMMKDRDVHFHVLPRYDRDQTFAGRAFRDAGWPGAPDLGGGHKLPDDDLAALIEAVKAVWPPV